MCDEERERRAVRAAGEKGVRGGRGNIDAFTRGVGLLTDTVDENLESVMLAAILGLTKYTADREGLSHLLVA